MATIKSYTDISQAKVLANILPLESADMYYEPSTGFCTELSEVRFGDIKYAHPRSIRCWSLAALLNRLPFPILYMEMVAGMILWCCECHFIETDEVVKIEHCDNPVDACFEMILKLHGLNLL